MTTALTPVGKVVTYPLRGDQAYATKDIEWADPSKPYSGAIYSAEAVESLRKRFEALEAELAACKQDAAPVAAPQSLDAQPVEAYQVMTFGNTQFLIKRADVAHETATRLKDQLGSDANVVVRPLYAAPVAAQPTGRCALCEYPHGHAIGCENNPVDIAIAKMPKQAAQPQQAKPPEHVCGLQGFGALGDECPACAQPANVAKQAKPLSDAEFAINMLEMMFTAYENGTPCYEDPDDEVGFVGYAVRLADDDFKNIGDFLNRVRPVQSGIKEHP